MLTTPDGLAENVGVLAVVVAELELRDVQRQIFARNLVERADHAALNQRPEALDCLSVNRADNVLPVCMVDSHVREVLCRDACIQPIDRCRAS